MRPNINRFNYRLSNTEDQFGVNRIDYTALIALRDSGQLVKGGFYEFEYQCKHRMVESLGSTSKINTGPVEIFIIEALSPSVLSRFPVSLTYPQDRIEFNTATASNLCEDGTTARTGVITYRHDTNRNIKVTGDFRALKYYKYKIAAAAFDELKADYAKLNVVDYYGILYRCIEDPPAGTDPSADSYYWLQYFDNTQTFKHCFSYNQEPGAITPGSFTYSDPQEFYMFTDVTKANRMAWPTDIECNAGNVFVMTGLGQTVRMVIKGNNNLFNGNYLNFYSEHKFDNNVFYAGPSEDNSLGVNFSNNIVAAGFNYNKTALSFMSNIIGEGCWYNFFNVEFVQNTVGRNFGNNITGIDSLKGNYEHEINGNTFGYFGQNNHYGSYIASCFFGSNTANCDYRNSMSSVRVGEGVIGKDFTGAPYAILASGTSCEIRKVEGGAVIITYYNSSNVLQIIAVT